MNQSNKVIELYLPQIDKFVIISCNKCNKDYVIYRCWKKMNETIDDYRLIEMALTNYCPFCGSKE